MVYQRFFAAAYNIKATKGDGVLYKIPCECDNVYTGETGRSIPVAWIPTIKQHNSRSMRTYEGTPLDNRNNNEKRG